VVTAGSDTLTVTWGGSHSRTTYFSCAQFTAGQGDTTVWTVDTENVKANTSSTTVTWPSLTPTQSAVGELYVGSSVSANNQSAGATSGYTYKTDGSGSEICYNPSITAVSAPTATQSPAGTSETVGALIRAFAGSTTTNSATLTMPPVPTGRMWVVSQIGFEILPATNSTGITATITLNGRTLYGNINANGGFQQGPPYVSIRSGDNLEIQFDGAPVGASMVANFFYNEYSAYATPHDIGGLV
jgi:hypothetical protein